MEVNATEKNIKLKYFGPIRRIVLIFFIGFSLFLFMSFLMIILLTDSEKNIKVPDVVGKSFTDVHNTLTRKGLKPEIKFRDVFDLQNGIILDQYPESGEIASEDSTIRLTIARSGFNISVPNVVGTDLPIAINKLKNIHYHERTISLSTGVISYIKSDKTPANIVIAQSPEPGQNITPDNKINRLVSNGKKDPDMRMPRIAGQSIDLAYDLVSSLGVIINEEIVNTWNINESGKILTHTPYARQSIKKGDTVNLTIKWYPLKEHPYTAYEKYFYKIPETGEAGLYEAYIEDNKSKRIRFSKNMKPGQTILFVFERTGNAKITITHDNKIIRVSGINVE